jgi:hypothetical protein
VNRLVVLARSKTVWGAVFTAGAWLCAQPKIGPLEVIQAVASVITAIGVRDAIRTNAP